MIYFISCCEKKLNDGKPHPACELYQSPFFKNSLTWVRRRATDKDIFILSAKYGCINPDAVIEYYNQSLYEMTAEQRSKWADMVKRQFVARGINPRQPATFLTGRIYSDGLQDYFTLCLFPLGDMSVIRRVHKLQEWNKEEEE